MRTTLWVSQFSLLSRAGTCPVMAPLWKIKVELEQVCKDVHSSSPAEGYEIVERNKFSFTKSSIKMVERLLRDQDSRALLRTVDRQSVRRSWCQPSLSRSQAEQYLQSQHVGAFVVRISNGKRFFALSLKSDEERFDHYKIERTAEDQWRIVGCSKMFLSLSSLVVHLSFLKEMLPVPLSRDLVT